MYALIYDEHEIEVPQKKVISIHASREEAEGALEKRKKALNRKVWECNTRIVWTEKAVVAGGAVAPGDYVTWRAGEHIPTGDLYSDED